MLPAIAHVECIVIAGADARRFAQAQFSGDVDALAPGRWQWNAWLGAQGRVLALMQLADPGDGSLLAVLRGGDGEAIWRQLSQFLLRSKASLRVESFAGCAGGELQEGAVRFHGGMLGLGYGSRSLWLDPELRGDVAGDAGVTAAWQLAEIAAGWPMLPRQAEPRLLPPALGLERLEAVSFKKGCYPGQEIVARLHYRGGHKWQLGHLSGPRPLPLGECLAPDGSLCATVLATATSADACHALAVIGITLNNTINILETLYRIDHTFRP